MPYSAFYVIAELILIVPGLKKGLRIPKYKNQSNVTTKYHLQNISSINIISVSWMLSQTHFPPFCLSVQGCGAAAEVTSGVPQCYAHVVRAPHPEERRAEELQAQGFSPGGRVLGHAAILHEGGP